MRLKHILAAAAVTVVGVALAVSPALAQQQPCEFPIFIEQGGSEANVIFLFDSSGSMDIPVYHYAYDQFTVYNGSFRSNRDYYVGSDGSYTPRSFSSGFPNNPPAFLVNSDNGESGRYPGNYLNWIYFNATDTQRASIPVLTRIQGAKIGVQSVVDETDNVRLGLWKFNGEVGGKELQPLSTDKASFLTELGAIRGEGWTPLAEAMEDILDALEGDDSNIQFSCQKTFIIVVTDGYPTKDLGVRKSLQDYDKDGNDDRNCQEMGSPDPNSNDCSDYLDDVALYLYDNDLSDHEGFQNATTYTIGFALDANILQDTADNGGGLYFNADNTAELQAALANVLSDIISQLSSGTAVSVVSAESAAGDRVYRAKFEPGTWRGDLESFALPYDPNDNPVWKAGNKLKNRDPDTRRIYTSTTGSNKMVFKDTKIRQLTPQMNVPDEQTAGDVLRWTRGEDFTPHRDRSGWKLGDIVNSSPIVVGKPASFHTYNDYPAFRQNNKDRTEVIYITANDGMLHAFKTSNGREWWAYIPNNMLPRLQDLMDRDYCHQFYLNSSPKVFDAFVGGSWKTLLIAGNREGGNGYFCLDVTDPRPGQFKVMWDRTYPQLAETWSAPALVRDMTLDKHVAVVTSGPKSGGANNDARMLVLDLETGDVIDDHTLSTRGGTNMATEAVVFDRDFDEYDDLLYLSDFDGNLWRYDVTQRPWEKSLLFKTNQEIQASPILSINEQNDVLLYFGTGKYVEKPDVADTSPNTFYNIIDNHSGHTVTRANLADQTYSITQLDAADRGWFIDLKQAPGERITRPDALAAGTVYFTSFQPTTIICQAGGRSWLYAVDFEDGSNSDDDEGNEDDDTDERIVSLGDGIHSEPILDITNEDIIVQSTDTGLTVRDTNGRILRILVRSWRQRY